MERLTEKEMMIERYKTVMDIRKFEIEMYWKRATYFWAFIVLAFGSYGAILSGKWDADSAYSKDDALFFIACLGLVFSVAWYYVNRGSKFWQRNWEYQADLHEDAVVGEVYRRVYGKMDDNFFKLTSAYPFSVSNINHILSLFFVVLFVLLLLYVSNFDSTRSISWPKFLSLTAAILAIGSLTYFGLASSFRDKNLAPDQSIDLGTLTVRYTTRSVAVKNPPSTTAQDDTPSATSSTPLAESASPPTH